MAASTLITVAALAALLVGSAYLPKSSVRWLGAAAFGTLFAVFARFALGWPVALLGGALLFGVAARWAPELVLRRITFLVPALLLLVFATTLLMFAAPGNPFTGERAMSPSVEA
ncbi:MAG TPA: hypothetical protein VFQ61_28875, partial [Polyangiaceae bacterium]|nr:hypothetical protein [Polyangiaceae bacterium]